MLQSRFVLDMFDSEKARECKRTNPSAKKRQQERLPRQQRRNKKEREEFNWFALNRDRRSPFSSGATSVVESSAKNSRQDRQWVFLMAREA